MTQAKTIGKTLMEECLAACVHVIDGMESIYQWEDKICEDSESVVIVKVSETFLTSSQPRLNFCIPIRVAFRIAGVGMKIPEMER